MSADPRREAAYAAVYEVIRRHPPRSTDSYGQAAENARIWRAVHAALNVVLGDQADEQSGPTWCVDRACPTAQHGAHWHSGPPAVAAAVRAESIARATERIQAALTDGRLFVDVGHSAASAIDTDAGPLSDSADALRRGVAAVVNVRAPALEAPPDVDMPLEPPPGAMVVLAAPYAELVTYRRGRALQGWRPLDADPGVPALTWSELLARGEVTLLVEQNGTRRFPPPYPADLEPHLRLPERPACGDPEHRHWSPCRTFTHHRYPDPRANIDAG